MIEINEDYNLSDIEKYFLIDCSIKDINLYLPTIEDYNELQITIIKKDSTINQCIIHAFENETIEGKEVISLSNQFEKIKLINNDTMWFML